MVSLSEVLKASRGRGMSLAYKWGMSPETGLQIIACARA
jgi:hypothetical protein